MLPQIFRLKALGRQSDQLCKKSGFGSFALGLCFVALLLASTSCGSKPIDPRTVIPGDSLVYLEANDLESVMRAVTDNPTFEQLAKAKPDFSALSGIRLAVAVTGFETSEQQVADEQFIGKVTPRFVAVAETNAWKFQAESFTENQLGEFINGLYGGEVDLTTEAKYDGKFYVWTSRDGRKAFALVQGSVIFFGNDESSIEKCLAVKRGEAESIANNPKTAAGERLAFGYVSPEGFAQIANLAGASFAVQASEDGSVMSFIARVLPEIVRNSANEATWTAVKGDHGIEDRLTIAANPEVAKILNETLVPSESTKNDAISFLPADIVSATRYDLKEPQIAWRSVLLTAQKQTDVLSGDLLVEFSSALFEPYAIADPETFLSAVQPHILTAKFDADGDRQVVIAGVGEWDKIMRSIDKDINFTKKPEEVQGGLLWKSEDGELSAAFTVGFIIVGDTESVRKCIAARFGSSELSAIPRFNLFAEGRAAAVTFGSDPESAAKIVDVISARKDENANAVTTYITETRFNQNGIERRTISDSGLIGSMIEQFARE